MKVGIVVSVFALLILCSCSNGGENIKYTKFFPEASRDILSKTSINIDEYYVDNEIVDTSKLPTYSLILSIIGKYPKITEAKMIFDTIAPYLQVPRQGIEIIHKSYKVGQGVAITIPYTLTKFGVLSKFKQNIFGYVQSAFSISGVFSSRPRDNIVLSIVIVFFLGSLILIYLKHGLIVSLIYTVIQLLIIFIGWKIKDIRDYAWFISIIISTVITILYFFS